MKVYKLWTQMSEGLNQAQAAAFWQEYFDIETGIYDQILKSQEPHIQGSLEELAQGFGVENPVFAGFLDGINTSIEPSFETEELEELEEDSKIDFTIDYEKLFYNMLDAKAKWLYELKSWEPILDDEKRTQIRRDYRDANTRRVKKVGRNDPCPCGSGKKYKFCCMNKE